MAKAKYPETSQEAFRALNPVKVSEIHQQILWGLKMIGSGHYEDISYAIKRPKEKVWRRLKELEDGKLIYRDGTKKLLSTGRNAMVWRLVEKEGTPEKVTEKALPGKGVADYSRKILGQTKLF